MREEAPHPSQPIRLAREVAQSLLERGEIAGPVARVEDGESDDTKRRSVPLNLISVDACNSIRGVPERSAPECPEDDMLHPVIDEGCELG